MKKAIREQIEENKGKDFAIHGTKKQLLSIEKDLKNMGFVPDDEWNNFALSLTGNYKYIVIYDDLTYDIYSHDGGCEIIINL